MPKLKTSDRRPATGPLGKMVFGSGGITALIWGQRRPSMSFFFGEKQLFLEQPAAQTEFKTEECRIPLQVRL